MYSKRRATKRLKREREIERRKNVEEERVRVCIIYGLRFFFFYCLSDFLYLYLIID